MATTLIVSDIHLGAHNSEAASLTALLRPLQFDRLILNGDTVDNLNFRRFRPVDWTLLEQLRVVAQEREVILLRGNHEVPHDGPRGTFGPLDALAELIQAECREVYHLLVGRRRYLVLHGDRFDQTLNLTWIGDAADTCYQWVQRCSRPTARWLKSRVKYWGGVVEAVQRGAIAYAREHGCGGIIAGHTHFSADEWIDDIHYLNSGCWVDAPCNYLWADGETIRLYEWPSTPPPPSAADLAVAEPVGELVAS